MGGAVSIGVAATVIGAAARAGQAARVQVEIDRFARA